MEPYSRLCGIFGSQESLEVLFRDTHVEVVIVDANAHVTMHQRFTNTSHRAVAARYMLLMPRQSIVCWFEMIRTDGTKVKGQVVEKTQTQRTQEAKTTGGQYDLGEGHANNLFSISVGAILPSETVTVKTTFLTSLNNDERTEQLSFIFPKGYAPQLTRPPLQGLTNTNDAAPSFSLNVRVQQAGTIRSITSPSHLIEVSLGATDDALLDPSISSENLGSAKTTSPVPFLSQDFVLHITAEGLDVPYCIFEQSEDGETIAMNMAFFPRFKELDVEGGMEFIFAVDRSNSMAGIPIRLLREALVVLLRGLPTKNTTFNIFSFGTRVDSLWPESRSYRQATLDEATTHVDAMKANYGGTEMAAVLKLVFDSIPRERRKPVAVFLLTDGESWDLQECKDMTSAAVAAPGPLLRVFTVGIGNQVSTDTTETIARAGNGKAVYIHHKEPMTAKLTQLVREARSPIFEDLQVLWPATSGDDFAGASPSQNIRPVDLPVPSIQQAPQAIPRLTPGKRVDIFAIVSSSLLTRRRDGSLTPIRVRGKLTQPERVVEIDVNLTKFSLATVFTGFHSHPIHLLAARALLHEREQGDHVYPPSVSSSPILLDAYLRADIVRLGTKYGLTSRYTELIAIDEKSPRYPLGSERRNQPSVPPLVLPESPPSTPSSPFSAISSISSISPISAFGTPNPTNLSALARLQLFDGSFTPSDPFFQFLDISFRPSGSDEDCDKSVTAIALVWMRREMAEDGKDMIQKADQWLRENAGRAQYQELIHSAEEILG